MSDTLEPKSKQIPNPFPSRQVVSNDRLGPGYGQLRISDSAQVAEDAVPSWLSMLQLTPGVTEDQIRELYSQMYDVDKVYDRRTAR